jgi:hypothetical protein
VIASGGGSGPPPIASIIADAAEKTDVGYALRIHLHGLHGAWHRLWGMMILRSFMGDVDDAGVEAVRQQVDEALGRRVTDEEMSRLDHHAREHARAMTKQNLGV